MCVEEREGVRKKMENDGLNAKITLGTSGTVVPLGTGSPCQFTGWRFGRAPAARNMPYQIMARACPLAWARRAKSL